MAASVSLSVVVPALNEEMNLKGAVTGLINALADAGTDWEIIIVNDGSTDGTAAIAARLAAAERRVRVIDHPRPAGIGSCFRDGVAAARKEAVTWFPGDGENEPRELVRYLSLLDRVDIVVPFVINKEARSLYRRFVSRLYLWLVNTAFGTSFRYTTGNVIYRRDVFDKVKFRSNGFIYQTECLLRAARAGFTYAQVPVRLGKRAHGRSKILTFRSVASQAVALARLFASIYLANGSRKVTLVKETKGD